MRSSRQDMALLTYGHGTANILGAEHTAGHDITNKYVHGRSRQLAALLSACTLL